MNAPANTLTYFIAGYTVIFGAILVYLVSIAVRMKKLKQDETMLREVEKNKK